MTKLRLAALIFSGLLLLIVIRFFMLAAESKSGHAPGMVAGKLAPCPERPNCVSSEFRDDQEHYLAPIPYNARDPFSTVIDMIETMGGVVAAQDSHYVSATFQIALFGFVDDFECRLDKETMMIHVRSASRVGYSDLGVNRRRAEDFVALLATRLSGE